MNPKIDVSMTVYMEVGGIVASTSFENLGLLEDMEAASEAILTRAVTEMADLLDVPRRAVRIISKAEYDILADDTEEIDTEDWVGGMFM